MDRSPCSSKNRQSSYGLSRLHLTSITVYLTCMSLCCEGKPEDPEKGTGRACRLHRDWPSRRADSLPSPGSPPFLTLLINLYSHCISFIHIMQTYVCKSKCNRTCWHLSNKKRGRSENQSSSLASDWTYRTSVFTSKCGSAPKWFKAVNCAHTSAGQQEASQ